MKISFGIFFIALGVLAGGCTKSEPSYDNKPLSFWMHDLSTNKCRETASETKTAIQQIGTNALPYLLAEMHELGLVWVKDRTNFYHDETLVNRQLAVLLTFKALGPTAKPAIPILIEKLDENELVASFACYALRDIDPHIAAVVYTKALTNQNYGIRCVAADSLVMVASEADFAVPLLLRCLQDKSSDTNGSSNLRMFSASALGWIGKPTETILPALIEAMQKDDVPQVRYSAARALGRFEPEAVKLVPLLAQTASHDDTPIVREYAIASLRSFGSNSISALPALLAISTNDADPLVRKSAERAIKHIQSPEPAP